MTVGETMRLDSDGFARDALGRKTAAVDSGQNRVDHGARPTFALCAHAVVAPRPHALLRGRTRNGHRLLGGGLALRLGQWEPHRSTIVASGGRLRFSDSSRP